MSDETCILRTRLQRAVELCVADGVEKGRIGAAMVGWGAGLIQARADNPGETLEKVIGAVRDAVHEGVRH